jgi:hypothetical protein
MLIARLWRSVFAWNQLRGAVEGAIFAATMTWLLALYKWHKADSQKALAQVGGKRLTWVELTGKESKKVA